MRHFPILAWAGRLYQRGAALPKAWDPAALRFEDEATVNRILALMPTDYKILTLEEIEAAVESSAAERISRVLWVPEDLLEEVRRRVLRQPS